MKLRLSLFVLIMITGQCFGQSNNLYCYKPSKTMINSSDAVKQNKTESVANLKACKGIGSYKLGDVYIKNGKVDKRFPSSFFMYRWNNGSVSLYKKSCPVIEEKYNPVLFFKEGCRIWTTKKSNKIYKIALMAKGNENKDDIKYAIEFLQKHYGVNPKLGIWRDENNSDVERYCRFIFADGVEVFIERNTGFNGYLCLVCKSTILEKLHDKESEEFRDETIKANELLEKKQTTDRYKNMDSSGLD